MQQVQAKLHHSNEVMQRAQDNSEKAGAMARKRFERFKKLNDDLPPSKRLKYKEPYLGAEDDA